MLQLRKWLRSYSNRKDHVPGLRNLDLRLREALGIVTLDLEKGKERKVLCFLIQAFLYIFYITKSFQKLSGGKFLLPIKIK